MLGVLLAAAVAVTGEEVVQKMVDADMFGFNQGEVSARATLKDKGGRTSEVAFSVLGFRYDPPNAKTVLRISAPADLAGAGFLQIQKRGADDDRFLFLPDLHKSRRIAGSLRSNAFMGTDFSFAELDFKDYRESTATLKEEQSIGNIPCYVVEVTPKNADNVYARIELWARKDNFLPVRQKLYDKSNTLFKTLDVKAFKKSGDRMYASRAEMTNHKESHTTDLSIEKFVVRKDVPDSEFTVRNLEKL